MALSGDDIEGIILQWWSDYQVDPRSAGDQIESGLRAEPQEGDSDEENRYAKYKFASGPCQYWIKGLPGVCKNWSGNKCTLSFDSDTRLFPTGYNLDGSCDGLGRREWCDKYESSGDKPDEYVCIVPSIERCGLGKQVTGENDFVSYRPYRKDEISGYNEGDKGVGRCDGHGTGRGSEFYDKSLDEKYSVPPQCKHYRPWIMGFGAIKPRPIRKDSRGNIIVPETLADLHDGTKYDPLMPMYAQVPFTFQIYTLRAKFQKCAYWDGDPAEWILDWTGGFPTLELTCDNGTAGVENICKCPDQYGCKPYKTLHPDMVHGLPDMIQWAWAEADTIICNGAKPECPCYTGKWNYVIDNKMRDGMRITSSQILELRYWADDWESQADYESAFTLKPGPDQGTYSDPSTDVIFTFDKWDTFNATDPNESVMQGRSSKLLVPMGEDVGKSFIPVEMVELLPVDYPKPEEVGSMVQKGVTQSFPTLIRELDGQGFDIFQLPPFVVVYPGDIFSDDVSHCIHNIVWMDEVPGVAIIGSSTPKAKIYAINLNEVGFKPGSAYNQPEEGAKEHASLLKYFKSFKSKSRIPRKEWHDFDVMVKKWLELVRKKTFEYYLESEADDTGAFYFGPLRIRHQGPSEFVIITDYTGFNDYDFRHRTTFSSFWGCHITQNDFISALPDKGTEDDPEEGFFPSTPFSFNPPAKVTFETAAIQGEILEENVFPVTSTMVFGTLGNTALVSYYISEYNSASVSEYWTQIRGNPSYIWADINSIDLNLLHEAKIDRAYFSLKNKSDDEVEENNINRCIDNFLMEVGAEIELELVYPNAYMPDFTGDEVLKREHSHPKYALLRTPLVTYKKEENGGWVFSNYGEAPTTASGTYFTQRLLANFAKEDWDLNFDFRYQKMEFIQGEEEEEEGEGDLKEDDPGKGEGLEDEGDEGSPFDDPEFAPPEEDEGEEGESPEGNQVWPPPAAGYVIVPNTITIEKVFREGSIGRYKIEGWKTHSAAMFCYNSDADGRYWAAAATKLVGQMNYLECKNVDIFYAYKAPAKAYDLQPSTGFVTWTGPPTVTPAGGGDTSGGGAGGNGDDPGLEDSGPGSPDADNWYLGTHTGENTNELNDAVFGAQDYYDSGAKVHYRRAKCGDHDCNPGNCIGPMWFPFNNCTNVDFYDVHTGPGACTASLVPEMDTPIAPNFRYGVADQFRASVDPGGNWASSCGAEWFYHYSEADMGGMQFAGYARIRGRIYRDYYESMGWALPPFGLTGRPFVERFITRDWTSHLMLVNNQWTTVFEFMPYVLDKVDLAAYLNCFEDVDEDNPIQEPFIHSSTLSWLSLSAFSDASGESMPADDDRYRFEDVLKVVWHGLCMYPYPLWTYQFGYRVARYAFTRDDISWVWRERWKPLERAASASSTLSQTSENQLAFLDLDQPEYYMDLYKEEHRLVADEGETDLIYKGPIPTQEEIDEAASKGDEAPDMKLPSIQLGPNGFQRFFKILYNINDYTDDPADWEDEGTQGVPSGSGGDDLSDEETADKVEEEAEEELAGEGEEEGEEESSDTQNDGSIYEQANDPKGTESNNRKWLHDYNTIFDEFAEPEPNEEERAAVVGIDIDGNPIYKYYNRGLVAGIPKNRLHWLPMYFVVGGQPTQGRDPDSPAIAGCNVWSYINDAHPVWTWLSDGLIEQNDTEESDEERNVTPYKITVRGKWGYKIDKETNTPIYYCIPRYSVDEKLKGITTNTDLGIPSSFSSAFELTGISFGFGEDGAELYKNSTQEERTTDNLKDYELEIILDPWPYRMLAKKELLTLTLEVFQDNFLAVSSIELINVEYKEEQNEHIRIWERKYLPATLSFAGSNPDGPNTKSFRNYDMNMRNAGQYYPAANPGAPVGNYKDKMVIISSGPYANHDQNVNLQVGSLSGLKKIEKNTQRELYETAYNLDNYDYTRYSKLCPPSIVQFTKENGVPFFSPFGQVDFISDKISWDMLGYQRAFIEDMDFWQPAGHYFQWADTGTSTRCYLFGVIRDVYTANFVHAHSDSKNRVATPGHAYNGWVRKEYYAGRQAQLEALGRAGDPGSYGYSDGLTAGKNRQGILAR